MTIFQSFPERTMKQKYLILSTFAAAVVCTLASCEKKSPVEKAADDVGDAVEEAADEVGDAVRNAD
ncbi:hypothetical protein [Luteolibacter marinus]|uniref:hypothetical protein n=1 Tax=Luteolibacter marinus TaxID=2776705 RepID=UPI0018694DA0|nr:hypothetical protein [Luteolibacter marinus]